MSEKLPSTSNDLDYLDVRHDEINREITSKLNNIKDDKQAKMDDFKSRLVEKSKEDSITASKEKDILDSKVQTINTSRIERRLRTRTNNQGMGGQALNASSIYEMKPDGIKKLSSEEVEVATKPRELNLIWHSGMDKAKEESAEEEPETPKEPEESEVAAEPTEAPKLQITAEEKKSREEKIAKLRELAAKKREEENPDRLIAVGIDWEENKEKMAETLAKADLEAETKKAGIIKKLWKGKIFRKFYEAKYTDEYLEGDRTDKNGRDLDFIINKQKQDIMNGLVYDAANEMRRDEREAMTGEKIVPADDETNDKIKQLIEDYAYSMFQFGEATPDYAKTSDFQKSMDIRFKHDVKHIIRGQNIDAANYLGVAKKAAERYKDIVKNIENQATHEEAMAKVMAGFRVYHVELKDSLSLEHKDNLQKIVEKLEKGDRDFDIPNLKEAVEEAERTPDGNEMVDKLKDLKDMLGGDEGLKIMLDKSPYNKENVARWQTWWDNLDSVGKETARDAAKEMYYSPNYADLDLGNDSIIAWILLKR